jgi:hypothetical protein
MWLSQSPSMVKSRCASLFSSHLGGERERKRVAGSFGRGVVPLTGAASHAPCTASEHRDSRASRSFLGFQEKACEMSSKSGRKGNSLDHLVPPIPIALQLPKKSPSSLQTLLSDEESLSHAHAAASPYVHPLTRRQLASVSTLDDG